MVLVWLGVRPHTKAHLENLGRGLRELMAEDSSLAAKSAADGTVLIGAENEAHLESIVDRLVHRYRVEAAVSRIEVAYKETVTLAAEGESKYVAQSGGRGEYAHVKVRVAPGEPGTGVAFEHAILGGAIPERMIASVEEGIAAVIDRGPLAGYPMDDLRISVYDGSYHDVDSSEAAFAIAGRLAFVEAARRAKLIVLEPIMNVSVTVPPEYESRIVDSLRHRGMGSQVFTEMVAGTGRRAIAAQVRLSQMFGYSYELRARTHRQGTLTMVYSHYAPASLSEDDGDRDTNVRSPLSPRTPRPTLRASVPEPHD